MKSIYKSDNTTKPTAKIPAILLKPETAAKALAMSRGTLEKNLAPHGMGIPYFRTTGRLFFSVDALRQWARGMIEQEQQGGEQ